jgi:penicillin-binding protein 2
VRLEHDVRGVVLANRESIQALGPDRRQEPVPGRDLVLSLDMELMRSLDRAFRPYPAGAAAVVDVRTGRVLALYSKPAINPNLLTTGITPALAREIEENPYRPNIDRSIYESYFPGSTFKPFTALAGLTAGLVDPRATVQCTGRHELGHRVFRCTHVHGLTDLHRSLVESCINQETPGFIPTRAWYAQHYPGQFRIGFTLNTAIGQGNTRVTVLQLAMAYAALANGGTLYVPRLVERVEGPDGTVIQEFPPTVRRQVSVSAQHLGLIDRALGDVISDLRGTAHASAIPEVDLAGKTGTAQVSRIIRSGEDGRRTWYSQRDHAWFAGFAPASNPEVAYVVLVEHGGSGGHEAAPVVAQVMRDWFVRIRPGPAIPSVAALRAREARNPRALGGR